MKSVEDRLKRAIQLNDTLASEQTIKEGVDSNKPDFMGNSPLQRVASKGCLEGFQVFVQAGADVCVFFLEQLESHGFR